MAILRVRTLFTGVTGSPWLSTNYFVGATPAPTQAEANAAVVKVGAFWTAMRPLTSSLVSFATDANVAVMELDGTLTGGFATTPVTGTGTSVADMLPIANQGLIRWLTNVFVGGRQVRGRTFVPGQTETSSGAGIPTATWLGTVAPLAVTLAATGPPSLVVWSETHASAQAVASSSVWTQWAVLRSRRD